MGERKHFRVMIARVSKAVIVVSVDRFEKEREGIRRNEITLS
jgi:hypothetical protein